MNGGVVVVIVEIGNWCGCYLYGYGGWFFEGGLSLSCVFVFIGYCNVIGFGSKFGNIRFCIVIVLLVGIIDF